MSSGGESVEALDARRADEATAVLARAFDDNPSTLAIFAGSSAEQRRRGLTRALAAFVDVSWRHGTSEVLLRDDRVAAVALSFGRGAYPPSIAAQALVVLRVAGTGLPATLRYARAGDYLQRLHPREPHWYLFFLGVEPSLQGRGLGGTLLKRFTERADRDRVIGYLETDRESNVGLYRRHGFEITTDEVLPKLANLRLWTMRRER